MCEKGTQPVICSHKTDLSPKAARGPSAQGLWQHCRRCTGPQYHPRRRASVRHSVAPMLLGFWSVCIGAYCPFDAFSCAEWLSSLSLSPIPPPLVGFRLVTSSAKAAVPITALPAAAKSPAPQAPPKQSPPPQQQTQSHTDLAATPATATPSTPNTEHADAVSNDKAGSEDGEGSGQHQPLSLEDVDARKRQMEAENRKRQLLLQQMISTRQHKAVHEATTLRALQVRAVFMCPESNGTGSQHRDCCSLLKPPSAPHPLQNNTQICRLSLDGVANAGAQPQL